MKSNIKIWILALVACLGIACNKSDSNIEKSDQEVISYRNMRGAWELESIDGISPEGDAYLYIEFALEDEEQKFTLYTNFDSAFASKSSGDYLLIEDDNGNMVISGYYDNLFEKPWESSYYVSHFTATAMAWVDTLTEQVRYYVRVESIPEDIVNGTRAK